MDYQIDFRPFKPEDARFVNDLRQIENTESLLGGNKRPVSFERDVKWIQDIILSDSHTSIYFAITEKGKDEIVGYVSISEMDFRNGTCFWSGIKLDATRSGKGWGTQAGLKVLKYVFEELRMERCKGECLEEHEAAKRMMLSIGFKVDGLLRSTVFKNGKHHNQYTLSVTKGDYLQIKEVRSL